MARYKKIKSKKGGVSGCKTKDGAPGELEKLAEKSHTSNHDAVTIGQELKKSKSKEKTSRSGSSNSKRTWTREKKTITLDDLSMLQAAIDERNALHERKGSVSSSLPRSLNGRRDVQLQKESEKNPDLAAEKNPEQLKNTSKQTENLSESDKSAELDEAQLFRNAVEQLSYQEIIEKKSLLREQRQIIKRKSRPRESARDPLKFKIDLHGLTVEKAKFAIEQLVQELALSGGIFQIDIITGKGLHSDDGPVLADQIYSFVQERFRSRIVAIESSPMETMIGGIPLRGSFSVTLRF